MDNAQIRRGIDKIDELMKERYLFNPNFIKLVLEAMLEPECNHKFNDMNICQECGYISFDEQEEKIIKPEPQTIVLYGDETCFIDQHGTKWVPEDKPKANWEKYEKNFKKDPIIEVYEKLKDIEETRKSHSKYLWDMWQAIKQYVEENDE